WGVMNFLHGHPWGVMNFLHGYPWGVMNFLHGHPWGVMNFLHGYFLQAIDNQLIMFFLKFLAHIHILYIHILLYKYIHHI
ncbi:hypothetical protein, partial [Capnocytophaga sp. CM59]|uniref:hypothetical protein n=1 Tax=Capnocytophaga sp. CM59 TaxID=936370 RepID=UPI00027C40AC